MKYSEITTEKIKDNLWIARTTLDPPLNCDVSIQGNSEEEAVSKLEKILNEE